MANREARWATFRSVRVRLSADRATQHSFESIDDNQRSARYLASLMFRTASDPPSGPPGGPLLRLYDINGSSHGR